MPLLHSTFYLIRKLDTYVPSVSIRLDQAKAKKLGQKLFKADRKDFYKAFPDLFSGTYVSSLRIESLTDKSTAVYALVPNKSDCL